MGGATMSEVDILTRAAQALLERENLRKATKIADDNLTALCRLYDDASGSRGMAPHHLAQSCRARGLMA